MKKLILLLFWIINVIPSFSQHPAYQYQLTSDHRKIILGESVSITLKIIDPMIYKQVGNEKFKIVGDDYNIPHEPPYYTCYLTITPKDTGIVKVGPYQVQYQGKKLTSNEIFITVVKKPTKDYLVFDLPVKAVFMGNGEIKVRSKGIDISQIELKDNPFFQVKSRGNSATTNTINEKKTATYLRSFHVDFRKKGMLKLTQDDLLNLPEQAEIEPDSILVE